MYRRRPMSMIKGHRSSFNYPHNWRKTAIFLVLNENGGMTARQVADESGLKLSTVPSSLSRWSSYKSP